jgi:hypothetical protein
MERDKSLLDNEKTKRKYRLLNNNIWDVENEYQIINCPHCEKEQYNRFTHIRHHNPQGELFSIEFHPNYNKDLDYLKELSVTYIDGEGVREVEENGTYIDGEGVREVEENGKWVLKKGEEVIGQRIKLI